MTGLLASMKLKITNRQFLSVAVIVFYLIPLLFFAILSMTIMPYTKSWTLFSLGLLLAVIGTLSLTLLLYYWEQSVGSENQTFSFYAFQNPENVNRAVSECKVTSLEPSAHGEADTCHDPVDEALSPYDSKELNLLESTLKVNQEQNEQLGNTLELKSQEVEKLQEENKQLELNAFQVAQDFADYKLFSEEQLKQKQLQITTLQQMIDDQRTEMEKRQDQIYQLDTKIHDLSYEIKTLLYLNDDETTSLKNSTICKEGEPSANHAKTIVLESSKQPPPHNEEAHLDANALESPVKTPVEASALLRKCINMAQKLTGANYHVSESSRYREFTSSFYTIDQRRLFDNLRSEAAALIIVYSQKENQLLFVNSLSKSLLGWSPEKFIADFSSIMQESINDWKKALSLLASTAESQARLLAKSKQGQEIILNCQMGVIPTGIFRHFVLGILYPACADL